MTYDSMLNELDEILGVRMNAELVSSDDYAERYDERLTEAVERANRIRSLVKLEGWEYYKRLVAEQIHERIETMLQPSLTRDGLVTKEFLSGEIAGLRLAQNVMDSLLSEAEGTIEAIQNNRPPTKEAEDE